VSSRDRELVIVGGGPAGLSTALFALAHAPRLCGRVTVLERHSYPREKVCAGAIGGRADRALAAIGVVVDVPSAPVRGLSVVTPSGTLVARRAEAIGRVVRRREYDAALAAIARDRGVEICEVTSVAAVRRESAGCTLELQAGGSLRARAVVGADGVGSVVRRCLGLGHGSLIAQAVEVDTEPGSADPDDDLLHFDVTDRSLRGYAWRFPTVVGGERLACIGVYDLLPERREGSDRPRRPDVAGRLTAYLEASGAGALRGGYKRFSERGLSLHEPTARPHVLLVGEAAGIDPVLGEGIAQAILYGQVAGPYLARCLERGELGFTDWPKTLAASRVGLDLSIRTRLAPWIYDRARPLAERFVAGSAPFANAGIHYFAGDRVPRSDLARATATLVHLWLSAPRAGRPG
jgi:menaquinone-9 beta-reductase